MAIKSRSQKEEEGPKVINKVHFVDLGHSTTPKRILCPLHINKPIMTYYADRNLYHCSSCGNIMNSEEESNKLHQDQTPFFLNDPSNTQRATPVAFALEPPHKRKGLQSIENQDNDSIVYSSAEEACRDDW